MAKKSKTRVDAHNEAANAALAPTIETPEPAPIPGDEAAEAAIAEDVEKARSVVQRKYKVRYRNQARANGIAGKAAKRSVWDWLAREMAAEVLDDKQKLKVDSLLALLDANAVDHSRWTNRSKGWEGRLRMTGRLALQRKVAESGVLRLADGETLEAPAEWLAAHPVLA